MTDIAVEIRGTMDNNSQNSPLRRWLISLLVWYILFMLIYLPGRFLIPNEWRFIGLLNNIAPYILFPTVIGLLIALLLRARRLFGLYLLATIIGALWIVPALVSPISESSATGGTILDVVTFNMYTQNTELDTVNDWFSGYAPDLIALQDAPDDLSALCALGAYQVHTLRQDEVNLALYTRYPVLEVDPLELDELPVQRLVLDIAGQAVVVYNVHFAMPLNDQEADWIILRYDETVRNAQIERLLAFIAVETDPVIVLGDFNMTEWSPIYHQVARQLDDAFRQSAWGIGPTWPAGESEELSGLYPRLFRIDYIWYSQPIQATRAFVGAQLGSDHLPVHAELQLP
ncbi:MAG: endonuclease/exonuclease/phosphatase family protein [Anaerolineae bacterium]